MYLFDHIEKAIIIFRSCFCDLAFFIFYITLPNVNYLAKIRNTNEMIESKIKEHVAAEDHATEEKKTEAAEEKKAEVAH